LNQSGSRHSFHSQILRVGSTSVRHSRGSWRDRLQKLLEPRSSAAALSASAPTVHAALTLLALTVREADHAIMSARAVVWAKMLQQICKVRALSAWIGE
jgi:hypothetical protein